MKRGQCATVLTMADLSEHDRREVEKFKDFLRVSKARKEGADPSVCNMLEAAIYPEGIGREPPEKIEA